MEEAVFLELNENENGFGFNSTIASELEITQLELDELSETINSIHLLKPDCDKLDYTLAIGSGALCGVIDIFLVGKPGSSPLGEITDKWFEERTKDFAKITGWKGGKDGSASSAIRYLENKFKIPYDQRGAGDAGKSIFGLTPANHHFKSLAHNPSIVGLFFSILDQFTNQSHFVSEGELIGLQQADDRFELVGGNVPAKFFCGFTNWIGHLFSDVSGSSGSQGRGMGIPSPIWTWSNDIIAIKRSLNLEPSEFDKWFNDIGLELFNKGYDFRFQTTQLIPVMINELVVRLFYTIRRLFRYLTETPPTERSFKLAWERCEPFSNASVKRMLTVAHGTFCLVDLGDATIRGVVAGGGAGFNPVEFFMRVNIAGIGRFTISLYGEVKRGLQNKRNERLLFNAKREKLVVGYYLEGLTILADEYDDHHLLTLISDFSNSDIYRQAFQASVELAEKRHVPDSKILHSKNEGDAYFRGGKS